VDVLTTTDVVATTSTNAASNFDPSVPLLLSLNLNLLLLLPQIDLLAWV